MGGFANVPGLAGGNNQPQQGQPQQGGDVPAFDLPPPPNMGGGMPGSDRRTWSPYPIGGQGPAPQMSDDDYLNMMYQTQLGRQGDQGGMDYWRQQMAGGMGRDDVMNAMRGSSEGQQYQQRMAPMMDSFPVNQMPQMDPQVMDALRLAQQRPPMPPQGQMPMPPQGQMPPQQGQSPRPQNMDQIMSLLGQLGVL